MCVLPYAAGTREPLRQAIFFLGKWGTLLGYLTLSVPEDDDALQRMSSPLMDFQAASFKAWIKVKGFLLHGQPSPFYDYAGSCIVFLTFSSFARSISQHKCSPLPSKMLSGSEGCSCLPSPINEATWSLELCATIYLKNSTTTCSCHVKVLLTSLCWIHALLPLTPESQYLDVRMMKAPSVEGFRSLSEQAGHRRKNAGLASQIWRGHLRGGGPQ